MPSKNATNAQTREVRYEHSRDFVKILRELGVSLLVSTYQAGKVVVLGTRREGLTLSFHNFQQAMGCAVSARQLAIASKTQIWFLQQADSVVAQLPADQQHDACYLARSSHMTDAIDLHELAWCGDELWFVNTRFSCLCTWDREFSFVPRWSPPFITQFVAEDRCHLNGLCVIDGSPRYVTAMSETDTAEGWRPVKASAGCVIDVASGEVVARGFAMPHSPRGYQDRLWVLDSGRGRLTTVDPRTGIVEAVTQQPGYTRGLAFAGPFAFIGLSRIRETSTFGGLPIAENLDQLKCAVAVVDLRSGKRVAYFEFLSGVEEIFDVQLLANCRNPYLSGPLADLEGGKSVWFAPSLRAIPSRLAIAVQPFNAPSDSPGLSPHSAASSSAGTKTADAVFAQLATTDAAMQAFQKGNELIEADQFEAALPHFQQAVELSPGFAEAHCNYGLTLQFLGRFAEAKQRLITALAAAPNAPAPHMNLATTLFLNGELHSAWHEYEWRWRCTRFTPRPRRAVEFAPAWDGSSLAGRTLLVFGEQGIGDEVMFASCLAEVIAQSARCVVACDARLVPLFQRSFPQATVVPIELLGHADAKQRLGKIDCQLAVGSLPRFLRPTLSHFPRASQYLLADEQQVALFRERLSGAGDRWRVGISWKGGGVPEEQRRRSSRLEEWQPILAQRNAEFVSLQYGDNAEELAAVQERLGVTIQHWTDVNPLRDLDSFAAQIAALDLVISIDNSTLHFAGALGIPALGLISFPSSSSWRWFADGESTPWYASVRLIRRRHPNPWQETLQRAAEIVNEFGGKRVPISRTALAAVLARRPV